MMPVHHGGSLFFVYYNHWWLKIVLHNYLCDVVVIHNNICDGFSQ